MAATAAGKPTPEQAALELLRREVAALSERIDVQQGDIGTLAHHSVKQNGLTPKLAAILQRCTPSTGATETRPAVADETMEAA